MCVMFGELFGGAACCVGGQEKEWRYFLDELKSFRYQSRPVVVDNCRAG